MRNGPRNYWETDRLLLLGTHRRGRGRDLQVLILKIRRKEEEEEEKEEEEENNNNNNNDDANNEEEDDAVDDDYNNDNDDDINNDGEDDDHSSSKRPSACLRITKVMTIMRNVHSATGVQQQAFSEKKERREMGDLLYLCVPVERSLCT